VTLPVKSGFHPPVHAASAAWRCCCDLARGHSLVAALRGAGMNRLFHGRLAPRSAECDSPELMTNLADLNVLVDHSVAWLILVGLSREAGVAVYAGEFPAKVRKLVMAGTPVDTGCAQFECRLSPRLTADRV